MAQLKNGKTYIVENIGVKNYIDLNGSGHTVAEYFTWLSEKIAAGLDIEMQPIIKENNKCFLPLPYINKPTKNRLCLYIGGESLNNIIPKIGYFNEQDYYIENADELPRIMYNNQNSFIVINNGAYSKEVTAKNFLDESTSGTFVIDTNFLDAYGFYNIAFLANASCDSSQNEHITEVYASPRVFICDMFNVLTEQHYDGAFTLVNPNTNSSLYAGGYVLNNSSSYNQLGYPSIAAIGVDKDGKYCIQGFLPQVFTSDYDNAIISASMIRIQFGKLKTYYPMYITLGNAIENLINYCDSTNVWKNKTWYKEAFEIDNKKFTISCSCDKTTFSSDNPQWAVVVEDKEENKSKAKGYLKFSSDGDFYLTVGNDPDWEKMEYSLNNGKTWAKWNGEALFGDKNKSIYIRGTNNKILTKSKQYGYNSCFWSFTGKYIDGNIETLLDYKKVKKGEHPSMEHYCYSCMFYQCSSLERAPKLSATILTPHCYYNMFGQCISLKEAPELPAMKMEERCYDSMFKACHSLKEVPDLPATTLATYCYNDMFTGCTSLTETHKVLPAMTLANGCYHSMYYDCSSITKTYKDLLPATTLTENCYRAMFSGCSSLKNVPKLPATTLANCCYYYMFIHCSSLEEVCELPATVLKILCYNNMFRNCSKIKLSTSKTGIYTNSYRIPSAGSGTNASSALNLMFTGTGGSFTGAPNINQTYYTSNKVV